MEIHNIEGIEQFRKELSAEITDTIYKSADMVVKKAQQKLLQKIPRAGNKSSDYNDTLLDAIYFGKAKDNKIKITSLGNQHSGSGTYRTRFFVGGTKPRFVTGGYRKTNDGIKYVQYKKPAKTGSITATNSITEALNECTTDINNLFKHI